MKYIVVGRKEIPRLIAAINATSFTIKSRAQKRKLVAVHLSLTKAVRDCAKVYELDFESALAISDALEIFTGKPFLEIIKGIIYPENEK